MAKTFVQNETVIDATDANKWEGYEAKITSLEQKTKNSTKTVAGIAKQMAKVNQVSAPNAENITGTSADEQLNKLVTLTNQIKIALNDLLQKADEAGLMSKN